MVTKPQYPWISKFADWVVNKRWYIILGTLIITFMAASGAQHLGFNNDYRVFFSPDNPQLKALDNLQATYTKDDNIFVVLEPKDGNVFTKETLAAIEELTKKSWQTPFSSRVDAITNFQHTYSEEDDLFVEDLVDGAMTKSEEDIAKIKTVALKEPLLVDRLISKDGRITGVNITLKLPGKQVGEEAIAVKFAREMTAEFEKNHPNIKTYLSGVVMLSNAFGEAAQLDMSTLIPLMFLVVLITILLTTRSINGVFVSLIVLIFSVASAMGIAGWMGIELTAPAMSAPTMILTIAVADSIHILITMLQYMRAGNSKIESVKESIRVNFLPVFITSLTTVIGFLTMNFSEVPPFHDLGNITAIGISAAFFFSILTLPALMSVLPTLIKKKEGATGEPKLGFSGLSNFVIKNNKSLLWISTFVVIIVSSFITMNQLNEQFVNYFDERIQFRTDTDFLNDNLTGIYTIEYSLNSGENGGINNPEYLNRVERFKEFYEKQSHVVHVNAFTEVAKRINRSMHGDNEEYYAVPKNRNEAAQYLLLYEMSLPYGLDLNNQMNVSKSSTRFTVTTENITSVELIKLATAGETWLKENAPKEMYSDGTGTAIMFSHITQRQIYSMISGNMWAIGLISIVMIFALRNLKFGLLSIIPNVLPILAGFGVWGLLVGEIDSGLAMVFGMTLGIVVDDSVHFMTKYLRATRELGKSPEDAVRYAFSTVGKAILVTSIILSAGFIILAQSSFRMNSGMAQMTAITIILALIIDMFLLPPLMMRLSKSQNKETNTIELENKKVLA